MDAIKGFIDFLFNASFSLWKKYFDTGGLYASITLAVVFVLPLLKKVFRSLKAS